MPDPKKKRNSRMKRLETKSPSRKQGAFFIFLTNLEFSRGRRFLVFEKLLDFFLCVRLCFLGSFRSPDKLAPTPTRRCGGLVSSDQSRGTYRDEKQRSPAAGAGEPWSQESIIWSR